MLAPEPRPSIPSSSPSVQLDSPPAHAPIQGRLTSTPVMSTPKRADNLASSFHTASSSLVVFSNATASSSFTLGFPPGPRFLTSIQTARSSWLSLVKIAPPIETKRSVAPASAIPTKS